jgi:hypothetical protein
MGQIKSGSIDPNHPCWIRAELRLLGITWFRQTIPKFKMHSTRIDPGERREFTLCFLDAAGERLLTIEHFATEGEARRVTRLFLLDEFQLSEAVIRLVDDSTTLDRECNPWIAWLMPPLGFGMVPFMIYSSKDAMKPIMITCAIGVCLTILAVVAVRRSEGIVSVSKEGGYITRPLAAD